jgi:hypothetical protein
MVNQNSTSNSNPINFNLRSKWRKVVTGNSDKRVRDYILFQKSKPENIKLIDKCCFTCGVLNLLICQFIVTNFPTWFWLWYSLVTPAMLISRWFYFKKLKYHYFMLDFCKLKQVHTYMHRNNNIFIIGYFTQLVVTIHIFMYPRSLLLFKMCFILSNGPLLFAIVVWRCSLVFHDLDKWTSLYVHLLPSLLTVRLRANLVYDIRKKYL